MSSLALVPYTFSLLKLPFIALQNVSDCLNPFEIYHFSRISKKTNKLAKTISKKATQIFLTSPFSALISFNKKESWSFKPTIEPGPDSYTVHSDTSGPTRSRHGYGFFSKKPASKVLKVLEWVIDLYKNSIVHLSFDSRSSNRQDLISHFNWFIENPSEVPFISMKCSDAEDVQFFIENYKKSSKKLNLLFDLGSEEELELPDNLETNLFEEVEIHNSHPVNFDLYNIFRGSIIFSMEAKLTNQDLNTFLKNWQSGLTNSYWRNVCFNMIGQVNLISILDGVAATYRDPRNVKRQINMATESFWIFGGIDIQKQDGTATATVQWKKYKVENEVSDVPIKLIREYERNQESGEIQRHEEGELTFERFLELHRFSMYIW
ncbi:hypothetical protein CAEBREN_08697 [Caenorhabditis brenneri]|uniref:F-box domain-containing protein n=1 Tax=Caenorhabditis brenneri TaxID=135651 RepID=G0N3P1_CAEBE|nr:hypothetical protein CAEBREN_08697 [Caenorhabditis brenneri]